MAATLKCIWWHWQLFLLQIKLLWAIVVSIYFGYILLIQYFVSIFSLFVWGHKKYYQRPFSVNLTYRECSKVSTIFEFVHFGLLQLNKLLCEDQVIRAGCMRCCECYGPGNTSATDNRLITAPGAELGRWTDKSDCLTWTGSLSALLVPLSTDSFRPDRPNYASAIFSVNLKLLFTAKS